MISVEKLPTATQVTIPDASVPPERPSSWSEWLHLEATTQRSRLIEAEADRMANDIKASWWVANKHRFPPPEQP